jgi:hypothetical protein
LAPNGGNTGNFAVGAGAVGALLAPNAFIGGYFVAFELLAGNGGALGFALFIGLGAIGLGLIAAVTFWGLGGKFFFNRTTLSTILSTNIL